MSRSAFFTGHDESVNVSNEALGLRLDNIGLIALGDNIFIGHGDNMIVRAGTLVFRSISSSS